MKRRDNEGRITPYGTIFITDSMRKQALSGQIHFRFCVLPLLIGAELHAQAAGNVHTVSPPQCCRSAAQRSSSVVIDGKLTEAAWSKAAPATGFIQSVPVEGAPAGQKTEVRFLFDDEAIYIGARMYDSLGAAGITSRLTRRDQVSESDTDLITVSLDTFHDHLGRATFTITPSGVRADAKLNYWLSL